MISTAYIHEYAPHDQFMYESYYILLESKDLLTNLIQMEHTIAEKEYFGESIDNEILVLEAEQKNIFARIGDAIINLFNSFITTIKDMAKSIKESITGIRKNTSDKGYRELMENDPKMAQDFLKAVMNGNIKAHDVKDLNALLDDATKIANDISTGKVKGESAKDKMDKSLEKWGKRAGSIAAILGLVTTGFTLNKHIRDYKSYKDGAAERAEESKFKQEEREEKRKQYAHNNLKREEELKQWNANDKDREHRVLKMAEEIKQWVANDVKRSEHDEDREYELIRRKLDFQKFINEQISNFKKGVISDYEFKTNILKVITGNNKYQLPKKELSHILKKYFSKNDLYYDVSSVDSEYGIGLYVTEASSFGDIINMVTGFFSDHFKFCNGAIEKLEGLKKSLSEKAKTAKDSEEGTNINKALEFIRKVMGKITKELTTIRNLATSLFKKTDKS